MSTVELCNVEFPVSLVLSNPVHTLSLSQLSAGISSEMHAKFGMSRNATFPKYPIYVH
jgi:hypothetical protein